MPFLDTGTILFVPPDIFELRCVKIKTECFNTVPYQQGTIPSVNNYST
jgi:hypothetical protein